jgi:hypothetical protein
MVEYYSNPSSSLPRTEHTTAEHEIDDNFNSSDHESLFNSASDTFLRTAPIPSPGTPSRHHKNMAWVVFHGRKMGIFETW